MSMPENAGTQHEEALLEWVEEMSWEDFAALRAAVGWHELREQRIRQLLAHTAYVIAARYDGKIAACARLLYDYGNVALISDVIVMPGYQGMGLGRHMIEKILEFVEAHKEPEDYVVCSLYTTQGKEPFYEKFGFQRLPHGDHGAGMFMNLCND